MLSGKRRRRNASYAAHVESGARNFADRELLHGLRELLKAFDYARLGKREVWDFAVEIQTLRDAGLTDSDFRWLTCVGHVDHACEVTFLGDDRRQFQRTGKLTFAKRTCFILTQSGAAYARSQLNGHLPPAPAEPASPVAKAGRSKPVTPIWDADRRRLTLGDVLVKQFKWSAVNQEMILTVFQEMGWPPRIDDPLPPQPEQDPKRRLHDTIKCLNRNQERKLIGFYGDGTGEGVLWKLVE